MEQRLSELERRTERTPGRFSVFATTLLDHSGLSSPTLFKLDSATGTTWEYSIVDARSIGTNQPLLTWGWLELPEKSAAAKEAETDSLWTRFHSPVTNSIPRPSTNQVFKVYGELP